MFIINTTSCVINIISIFYILFWSCAADMTVEGTKEDDWGLQRSVLVFFSVFGGEETSPFIISVPPLQLSRQDKEGILYQQKTYLEDNIFV